MSPPNARRGHEPAPPGTERRSGALNPIRVEQMGEELGPLDQPRTGAREGGGRVDRPDAARRRAPRPARQCLSTSWTGPRAQSQPHGIATTTSGPGGASSSQLGGARLLRPRPERVRAAGDLDHLRHPVAADERRVEPLQREHARPRRAGDRLADGVEARSSSARSPAAASGTPAASPRRVDVGEHLLEVRGVERDHRGVARAGGPRPRRRRRRRPRRPRRPPG